MSVLKAILGIGFLLVVLLLGAFAGAVIGALGASTAAFVVAGGSYFIGLMDAGTAQAVALWILAAGASVGALGGVFWTLVVGVSLDG
jgi:hypothetical protein